MNLNPIEWLEDLYYIRIKGLHKHHYVRAENGVTCGVLWQRHQCTDPKCKKIVGLDDWQIADLPPEMKYEKI